jgi:hypothetical protein
MQSLPFCVVTEENVGKIYAVRADLLTHSAASDSMTASCTGMLLKSRVLVQMLFVTNAARLRNYPQVVTRQDNDKFCEFLRTILNEQHVDFISTRAHGILTLPAVLPPSQSFLLVYQ